MSRMKKTTLSTGLGCCSMYLWGRMRERAGACVCAGASRRLPGSARVLMRRCLRVLARCVRAAWAWVSPSWLEHWVWGRLHLRQGFGACTQPHAGTDTPPPALPPPTQPRVQLAGSSGWLKIAGAACRSQPPQQPPIYRSQPTLQPHLPCPTPSPAHSALPRWRTSGRSSPRA
eukprot:scaffold14350_cov98-Isochrysis_galbana.AAC.1